MGLMAKRNLNLAGIGPTRQKSKNAKKQWAINTFKFTVSIFNVSLHHLSMYREYILQMSTLK